MTRMSSTQLKVLCLAPLVTDEGVIGDMVGSPIELESLLIVGDGVVAFAPSTILKTLPMSPVGVNAPVIA